MSACAVTAAAPRTTFDAPGATPGVGSEHDGGVEHRKQRVEIAAEGGSKEGVDNFSLASEIDVGNRRRCL